MCSLRQPARKLTVNTQSDGIALCLRFPEVRVFQGFGEWGIPPGEKAADGNRSVF